VVFVINNNNNNHKLLYKPMVKSMGMGKFRSPQPETA